jgi:hypothetical protein
MTHKVFISYSRVDSDIVDELVKALDHVRVPYFLDKKDIAWGDELHMRISGGLADSSHLLVVLSPASLKSQWVPFEIGQATALGKRVLPFLTHPSLEIPTFLRQFLFETDIAKVASFFARQDPSGPPNLGSDPRVMPTEDEDSRRAPAIRRLNWDQLEKTAMHAIQEGRSHGEVKTILKNHGVSERDADEIVREVGFEHDNRRSGDY